MNKINGIDQVKDVNSDDILTALQKIDNSMIVDDAAFTPATDSVTMAGATFDDAAPDSVNEGDAGALRMSGNRNLYVQIRDAAGNERGVNIDANNYLGVSQATHDNLNANVTLQIADADSPGGAGAVTASTPRIIHASDDPAVTALQVMDDWDETDRAKVNLIAGQVGVTGGTGVDAANVLRMSLATDIPLPTGSNSIGKLAANSGVDIGDVDVTSLPVGSQAMAAATPITLATDDTQMGAVGAAADVDGNLHGQQRYIGEALDTLETTANAIETATGVKSHAKTTAYAASLIVKASAGTFFGLTGYNSKTSAQFIQIHDASSLPADTAVPSIILRAEAQSNFGVALDAGGVSMATGIVISNSSTAATKTIGAADCWFNVTYI